MAVQAAGWDSATRFSFAVVTGVNDRAPVGHVVVKVGAVGVAEVGYWTAAYVRGRGIAARALETVSQWALSTQGLVPLTRLDLLHAEDNRASCRVAEKCSYLLPAAPPATRPAGIDTYARRRDASGHEKIRVGGQFGPGGRT
ncbi:GNAT family N-acetyltransferase [Amycolatopsis balhimycina]|uniref:GNAT family N-acetyltransferase n=1 Tax=Amycolatopsis balhimycina TaxID=208443 RepID=UPI0021AD9698|nr:GNAT family protein [Amycolatopsis balhimycina]